MRYGREREDKLTQFELVNFIREYSYFKLFDFLNLVNLNLIQNKLVQLQQGLRLMESPSLRHDYRVKMRGLLKTYSMIPSHSFYKCLS